MDYNYYKNLYRKSGLSERDLYIRYNNLLSESHFFNNVNSMSNSSGFSENAE